MSIDINFLTSAYFVFDDPVPYNLGGEYGIIYINPITLRQSEAFLSSSNILMVDKNSTPNPEIIQMSYLDFLIKVLLQVDGNGNRLATILKFCLGFENVKYGLNEKQKIFLCDTDKKIVITHKQFEDIRKIILYQNFLHFDDKYVNPFLKKSMEELDALKNKDIETPSLERRIAIISAHCGITKEEQLKMTYRAHTALFEEVCGEVEFTTTRPIAMLSKESANKLEHWIFKKKKDKIEKYITDVDKYKGSMGGGEIVKSDGNNGQMYGEMFENFVNNK